MVDWTSLALLVVGGYALIKYGPAIAANLKQTAAAAPQAANTGCAGNAAPDANNFCPCPDGSMAVNGQCAGVAAVTPVAGAGGGAVAAVSISKTNPAFQEAPPLPPSGFGIQRQNANVVRRAVAAIKARPAAPKCLCPTSGPSKSRFVDGFPGANCQTKGEICLASSNVGYSIPVPGPVWYQTVRTYQANMTQIATDPHTGQARKIVTIDPFFPAGWYVAEANSRASLVEPGLH